MVVQYAKSILKVFTIVPHTVQHSSTEQQQQHHHQIRDCTFVQNKSSYALFLSEKKQERYAPVTGTSSSSAVLGRSGVSWTICKQSAPRSRQTTTPKPRRSIFTGRMLFLTPNQQRQSTEGKSESN